MLFFKSQLSYCPLVRMFHSRTLNNRINKLHERCLRMSSVFNKKSSNFEELLELDGFVSVHTRNLETLAAELFKVSKNIAPKILKDIFSLSLNTEYNLRHQS